MENKCSNIKPVKQSCDCNYIAPKIKKLLIRKKNGQFQVKINGVGKWLGANYNKDAKTITFSA